MVKTDKYKKGVEGLCLKVKEFHPKVGDYQTHFITKNASFIVLLTNGQMEIGIDMARNFETSRGEVNYEKLKESVILTSNHKNQKRFHMDTAWRKLFEETKQPNFI